MAGFMVGMISASLDRKLGALYTVENRLKTLKHLNQSLNSVWKLVYLLLNPSIGFIDVYSSLYCSFGIQDFIPTNSRSNPG